MNNNLWHIFLGFRWEFYFGTTSKGETLSIATLRFEQMWFCLSKTIDSSEISWHKESCRKRGKGQAKPNKNFDQTDDAA